MIRVLFHTRGSVPQFRFSKLQSTDANIGIDAYIFVDSDTLTLYYRHEYTILLTDIDLRRNIPDSSFGLIRNKNHSVLFRVNAEYVSESLATWFV